MLRHAPFVSGFAVLLSFAAAAGPARADPLPTRIGQCSRTTIAKIETRLSDGATGRPIPGSGSAVVFANDGYQVSYDTVPRITRSRPVDAVRMCLFKIPQGCPPGDARGRIYKTTNLRTRQSWTLPDAEHSCGGA